MPKLLKIQTFYDPIFGFVKIIFPQISKNKQTTHNPIKTKNNV